MRVVLDSNVVIAAAASRGLCHEITEYCLGHHTIVICEGILIEVEEKLTNKLKVSPAIVSDFLIVLRNNSEMFVPEYVPYQVCRDEKDLMILGIVVPGTVDVIVTGDKDLLTIKQYLSALILSPRNFWDSNLSHSHA